MTRKTIGLLLMAYGTPRSKEEIEPYYTHIRRGNKPSPELLQDLSDRYEAIGGLSPLARITEEQQMALEAELNRRSDSLQFRVYLGLKHISPFIEDAVQEMKKDGVEEAISLVLAPHFSTFSVKSYNQRALEEAEKLGGPHITPVDSWYTNEKFLQYWTKQLQHTFSQLSEEERAQSVVIFSAHSLPEKILQNHDPYPEQLKETAQLIAERAGVSNYEIGWQSAGNTPEPWIGPDVQDLTRDLFEKKGYTTFIYCPVGFVAEHLEVLYDNDYECKVVTDEVGATYMRPPMPNSDELFISGLADIVLKKWNQRVEKVKV
ncbi:ferrochelatase [Mechercharimyces sp. CAU 1602]|uniref:ferrochelatase n=1 Tax=Mechercharimyces sp. CAU 1602 TaxID=2973933 RepID=UPI0021628B13|nr:ferrochelatase [Mechercharimyces sp. CAU 1602]MCS1351982.1 ferrochelatase [Mechercharimyces sp. CAU 1602]